jgi:hypothetical protein
MLEDCVKAEGQLKIEVLKMVLFQKSLLFAALLISCCCLHKADAAQTLIPAPYPENSGSTAEIGGAAGGAVPPSEHQNLIAHPMPQNLGPDAAGDLHPLAASHHQHLLKHPYWRQYHRYH